MPVPFRSTLAESTPLIVRATLPEATEANDLVVVGGRDGVVPVSVAVDSEVVLRMLRVSVVDVVRRFVCPSCNVRCLLGTHWTDDEVAHVGDSCRRDGGRGLNFANKVDLPPDVEVAASRDAGRDKQVFEVWRHLDAELHLNLAEIGLWTDTSTLPVDEAVSVILDRKSEAIVN